MATPGKTIHVALFPWFTFGHQKPFLHLSNQLAQKGFTVSFLSTQANVPLIKPFLRFSDQVQIVELTPPPPSDKDKRPTAEWGPHELNKLMNVMDSVQDQVEAALRRINPDLVVHDLTHYIPAMARGLGIKSIFLSVASAAANAYQMVPSRCPDGRPPSLEDLTRPPLGFPNTGIFMHHYEACRSITYYDRINGGASPWDRAITTQKGTDAILIKSRWEMEASYCDYLSAQYGKPVLLSGSILPDSALDTLEDRWETWLAQFEPGSVLYCSFGSADVLGKEDIGELLLGIEESGVPFMATLVFPTKSMAEAIPDGFMERVKNRGMIHSGWVQQQLILEHKSVGGYLCHAGFGSLGEAMSGNCQMVFLPLKADQFFNARLLSKDLKVGVEVERNGGDGSFTKDAVCRAVKSVMVETDGEVGREIRANHAKLRESLTNEKVQSTYTDEMVDKMLDLIK